MSEGIYWPKKLWKQHFAKSENVDDDFQLGKQETILLILHVSSNFKRRSPSVTFASSACRIWRILAVGSGRFWPNLAGHSRPFDDGPWAACIGILLAAG